MFEEETKYKVYYKQKSIGQKLKLVNLVLALNVPSCLQKFSCSWKKIYD